MTQGQPRSSFISSQKALKTTIAPPAYIVKNNFCSSEGEFIKVDKKGNKNSKSLVTKRESMKLKPSDASDLSMSPRPDVGASDAAT